MSWWAEALEAGAARPTAPVRLPSGPSLGGNAGIYPRVAGAANANGEPGDEVFVQLSADVYHGAAPPIDAVYGVRGDRVVPVTLGGKLFTDHRSIAFSQGDGENSTNFGGNILLSPPVSEATLALDRDDAGPSIGSHPAAPLGKLVVGDQAIISDLNVKGYLHDNSRKSLATFPTLQPIVPVNASWLKVGHVDEFISFPMAVPRRMIIASPAISNGQIFLRGEKHLYCIE